MNPVGFRPSLDKEPKEVNCLPAKKEGPDHLGLTS